MKIANQAVVSIHYTLKNDVGETLDSSAGRDPLTYLHGAGNLISGLERALEDRQTGDELSVTVPAAEAYGEYRTELVQAVPRTAFPDADQVQVGARFEAQTDNGSVTVVVKSVDDEEVVVDGNHPLAGQDLHFDVTIDGVRAATDEEIAHGHAH